MNEQDMTELEARHKMLDGLEIDHPKFLSGQRCKYKNGMFWYVFPAGNTAPIPNVMSYKSGYRIYKEKKTFKGFANIYNSIVVIHASKRGAIRDKASTCIAQKEVEIEYYEGEGLSNK